MLAVTLPDPVKEPFSWEQRVKAVLMFELKEIKEYSSQSYIVKSVFQASKDTGAFGNLDAVMALLPQAIADFKKIEEDGAESKDKIITRAKERGLGDMQINRILQLAAPHGYNSLAVYFDAIDKEVEEMKKATGFIPNQVGAAAVQTEYNKQKAARHADKVGDTAADKRESDPIRPAEITEANEHSGEKREPRPIKELTSNNDWSRTQAKLNHFYENIRISFNKYSVPHNKRSRCVHIPLNVKSIHETRLSALDCEIKVKAYIEREYAPKAEPATAPTPTTPAPRSKWLALNLKGKSALNSAFRQFKQELQKLKTVIYIEDDVHAALDDMELDAYIKQHGIAKACEAFDVYLKQLNDGKATTVTNQDSTQTTDAATHLADYMKTTITMGGVALCDIHKELNRPYDRSAMFAIPPDRRQPKGAQGIKPGPVRNRVNKVFGMETVGWRFTYHPNTMVHYGEEEREKYDEETKQTKKTLWYVVRLEMFIFEYRVVRADGNEEWLAGSPLSDVHANIGRPAAYHGAISSLLKQAVRSMGGFDFLDSSPSERPRQETNDKPREAAAQNAQGAQPDRPAAANDASSGLSSADVKELMQFADTNKIPRSTIIGGLGIQNWSQWTAGLQAAKDKLKGAVTA